MALSSRTKLILTEALADQTAGNEVVNKLNSAVVSAYSPTPQAPVVPVAVTYTSGSAPTITGDAITVADSTTPTVVELHAYCTALKANIASIEAVLLANGLVT